MITTVITNVWHAFARSRRSLLSGPEVFDGCRKVISNKFVASRFPKSRCSRSVGVYRCGARFSGSAILARRRIMYANRENRRSDKSYVIISRALASDNHTAAISLPDKNTSYIMHKDVNKSLIYARRRDHRELHTIRLHHVCMCAYISYNMRVCVCVWLCTVRYYGCGYARHHDPEYPRSRSVVTRSPSHVQYNIVLALFYKNYTVTRVLYLL